MVWLRSAANRGGGTKCPERTGSVTVSRSLKAGSRVLLIVLDFTVMPAYDTMT